VFPANKGKSDSIRCWSDYGPSFGNGELRAYWVPLLNNYACKSYSRKYNATYNIGVDSQERNMLTNQLSEDKGLGDKVSRFSISELEVWKVNIKKPWSIEQLANYR
jgi:hypothetical protein